jgi:teichuronic acid exporter
VPCVVADQALHLLSPSAHAQHLLDSPVRRRPGCHGRLVTETSQLNRARLGGAALLAGGSVVVSRGAVVIVSIAVARMLTPEDVGSLGLIAILIGVASMLAAYVETAAVVEPSPTSGPDVAVVGSVLRGVMAVMLAVGIWLTAPRFCAAVGVPPSAKGQFVELTSLWLWVTLFEAAASYPLVRLQRALDLSVVASLQLVQPLVYAGLSVWLLANGSGALGVVWAQVLATGTTSTLYWLACFLRHGAPPFRLPPAAVWVRVLRGGARLLAGGIGGFLSERLDNLLVSRALGPARLAYYSLAWTGSRLPAHVICRPFGVVLMPTLVAIQSDRGRTQRAIGQALEQSYLLLAGSLAIVWTCAPSLIGFLLGPKWLPLLTPLRIMCASALLVPLLQTLATMLAAGGLAHRGLITTAAYVVAQILLVGPAARQWGVVGAAAVDFILMAVATSTLFVVVRRTMPGLLSVPIRTVLCPCLSAVTAGSLGRLLLRDTVDPVPAIAGACLVASIYVGALAAMGEADSLRRSVRLWAGIFERSRRP